MCGVALENLTSNSENAARLSKFIQKYGTAPFEQNNALLQSVLKLNNESADAFLTVASKQGKKFFEALENCDGYLDEVIEMTIKKGDAYAAVLVKANAKGGADYLKTAINGAALSDEVLLSGKSVEQGSDYWRSISSYYETMVDVIKSSYKNLGNNAYTELNIITSNGNLEKSIKATSSTKKIDGFVELRGDKDASIDPERFFTTTYVNKK